jgi:hypothetical protein
VWRSWGIGGEEVWVGGCTSGVLGADKSLLGGGKQGRTDGWKRMTSGRAGCRMETLYNKS